PELGPSLLLALASLLALAGLLGVETGAEGRSGELLKRGLQLLLASLPVALALFLLLPRLDPFVSLPGSSGRGAVTGLDTTLEPGAIATLVASEAPAARVAFPAGGPPPQAERYWRVLVHDRFDGRRWTIAEEPGTVARGVEPARILELWLEEPSGLEAVPWSGEGLPRGREVSVGSRGELRHRGSSARRRVYTIGEAADSGWRARGPSREDLALPPATNPRLRALAADWARLASPEQRLAAAERWFRQRPFRYTLQPGTLPRQDPLDAFLFERRQGFCEHYASATTALMRAAGVPARVVSGYRGGTWVEPLGGEGYLDLRRSDAHAWSEVWLGDRGWVRLDPSAWIGASATGGNAAGDFDTDARPAAAAGLFSWIRRQWWGLDLAWTRLWLGFDQEAQAALLRRLLGDAQGALGLLLVALLAVSLGGAVVVLRG
ncbi:MAG: transglutaminaseTgpA domain-containing protein, partial [Synechococcaceae cyanobacterium]|nr:transglutaminaseTgpA domain-containing protein [Synechococcaceae cyanobacterium]